MRPTMPALILALAAVAGAQERAPYDAFLVFVERPEGPGAPRAVVVGARRLRTDLPARDGGEDGALASIGNMPGVEELLLGEESSGRIWMSHSFRSAQMRMGGTDSFERGNVQVRLPDWSDRRMIAGLGRGRRALVLRPTPDPGQPLALIGIGEVLHDVVASLLRGRANDVSASLRFLARCPLERDLDLEDRERLIAALRDGTFRPKLARPSSNDEFGFPGNMELSGQDLADAVRVVAGDLDPAREWFQLHESQGFAPMGQRRSLLTAGLAALDPTRKGLLLWLATIAVDQRRDALMLYDAVVRGEAILPGDEAGRAARLRELEALAAQSDVRLPLLATAASALGLVALVWGLGRLSRRALS